MTESLAHRCESVGPLATSTRAALKQLRGVVVAGKATKRVANLASVAFDPCRMVLAVLHRWIDIAVVFHVGVITASGTVRLVAPSEKVILEPCEQSLQLLLLVAYWPHSRW